MIWINKKRRQNVHQTNITKIRNQISVRCDGPRQVLQMGISEVKILIAHFQMID